jgi:DNA-directed RNA polymerase subunit beta
LKLTNQIQRHSFSKIRKLIEMPDLLEIQLDSFRRFLQDSVKHSEREKIGLSAVFLNVFPIIDNREEHILEFVDYTIDHPKYTVEECKERGVTYSAPLKARLRLSRKSDGDEGFGETVESDVYLGSLPLMTHTGTFIINGSERVVVSQLHRSPGVFFGINYHQNGTELYSARIIPFRGSWVEFTTDINNVLHVYIDRRKKFPVTTLLRAMGHGSNLQIMNLFGFSEEVAVASKMISRYVGRKLVDDVVNQETGEIVVERDQELNEERLAAIKDSGVASVHLLKVDDTVVGYEILVNTLAKDPTRTQEDALLYLYRELRNAEAPDLDTAKGLLERLFFDDRRYDLGAVGRYRMNSKLNQRVPLEVTVLTLEDIVSILRFVLELREGKQTTDDIDHLGNRRIRTVGEQLANQFSVALTRMARTIKERMNLNESERMTPQDLINVRTITSVINTFFGTNQLSQFMDQVNPLTELTHKRRISALGPGGLTRERAGFEVRDVHYTHYGRLCPIETPEGPNIGLISSLCTYARINELGFVETPYRKVKDGRVTRSIEFLSADDEDRFTIAQANAPIDDSGNFLRTIIKARNRAEYPGRRSRRGGVHGRVPGADRLRGRQPDPLPGARRRQPRPDGQQHAAPGRAPAASRRALCGHGHGAQVRHRQPRRGGGRRGRRDHLCVRHTHRAAPVREGRVPQPPGEPHPRVPPAEVRAHQPEHLHQPETPGAGGRQGQEGRHPRRRLQHGPR